VDKKKAEQAMEIAPKHIAVFLLEVDHLLARMHPEVDPFFVQRTFHDTVMLFRGESPGYRASSTKYHDLPHTLAVFLATARLTHGAICAGQSLSRRGVELVLAAALLHDAGFIQTVDDDTGTGAKYTIGHEERSITFMAHYLAENNRVPRDILDCAQLIACTVISDSPAEIAFTDPENELLGQILGTADLLAQMADRAYLEKLFLLYRELDEAGISGFDSELRLLEKTQEFYEKLVKHRLSNELGDAARFMRVHYRVRWDQDFDPYELSIRNNLDYLKHVLQECRHSYRSRFRRGGIVAELEG